MEKLPNLSMGKSSFAGIREKDDPYVDQTWQIFQMADEGEYYFLSRSRRFGKSLVVSTLKCLLEGREEFFKGMRISRHGG